MSNEQTIPAGFYKGRAIGGSEQYAVSSQGTEQIAIDVDVPSLNRQLTVILHFSDAAAPYTIEKLRACGWQGDDLSNLAGIESNEIDVAIKYDTWEGKTRMKVDISTGGGRIKLENTMGEQQKRAFAARMKSVIKGEAALSGRAPTAPRGPSSPRAPSSTQRREGAWDPGPPDTSDDIPF